MKKIFLLLKSVLYNERGDEATERMMGISLNMILLAFFIVLNSIAVKDEKRIMKAIGSLSGSFGILPWGQNVLTTTPHGLLPPGAPMQVIESIQHLLRDRLEKLAMASGLGKGFGIQNEGRSFVLFVKPEMFFIPNTLRLSEKGKVFVLEICALLNSSERPIQVRGYSDKKTFRSSWNTASTMATTFSKFMIEKGGLSPARFTVASYGNSRAAVAGQDKNRIEIFLKEGF